MKRYGTITLRPEGRPQKQGKDRPHWEIACEPYVRMRLKRLFERAWKGSHESIWLADTPEVARELLWFTERFPMAVEPLAYLERRSTEHKEQEAKVQAILTGSHRPTIGELAIPARDYQRAAAEMLLSTGRLLLADDLGTGKTASAICTLTDPRTLPALVVTLTHLPLQWQKEIQRFAPHLRTHVLRGTTPYPLDVAPVHREGGRWVRGKAAPFPDVILTSYSKLVGWADALAPHIKSVVFDEVQELRKGKSDKYSAAKHLAGGCSFRLGLSATPIYNYGGEFFHVLDVLAPDALGTREEFLREWCWGQDDKAKLKDPVSFGTHLRDQGLMLRRTRAEVGRELPGLTRVPHAIEADLAVLDKMTGSASELARVILQQGGIDGFQKLRAAEEFSTVLRQATGLAKAPFIADFVRLLVESGESVVLYGWHHAVYQLWGERLADLAPAFYTGEQSQAQKQEAVRRFTAKETPVLILSLRAGAGLDGLQHVCRTLVIGELDWSPGAIEQCIGRVYRDGQPDPVVAYLPIADHGCDPVMAGVLGLKRAQIEGVRDPDAPAVEAGVDPDHIKKLAESFLAQRDARRPARQLAIAEAS